MDKDYVIVRTEKAGVFAGYLRSLTDDVAVLDKARRIWYWDGASSLSELAVEGTSKPENCKFPCEVPYVTLFKVIEILPVSAKAQKSIGDVPVWKS